VPFADKSGSLMLTVLHTKGGPWPRPRLSDLEGGGPVIKHERIGQVPAMRPDASLTITRPAHGLG